MEVFDIVKCIAVKTYENLSFFSSGFFKKCIKKFFLAVLGFCCCVGFSLVVVLGLLIAVTFCVVELGL